MSQKDYLHRAEMGDLWYDHLRQQMAPLIGNVSRSDHQQLASIAAYEMTHGGAAVTYQTLDKLRDFAGQPSNLAEGCQLRLPVRITASHDMAASFTESTTQLKTINPGHHLLGEYARYAFSTGLLDLMLNEKPAEVLVSDARLIESVINSNRSKEHPPLDLWHVPFERCWWEFSRPVQIAGAAVRAVAFYCRPEIDLAVGSLLMKKTEPYYATFSIGMCAGVATGGIDPPFAVEHEQAYTDALSRLWDFVTCRNITYEPIKRSRSVLKRLQSAAGHEQGANSTTVRQVIVLKINRAVQVGPPPEKKGDGGAVWGFRASIPGSFHRWVYCGTCGDVHRHDLIGSPCRRCGIQVGPRANVRVEKYWHESYIRGPESAPLKETVRQIKK